MRSHLRSFLSAALALSWPVSRTVGVSSRRLRANSGSALHDLQSGGVAPVDLAQAAIGPGMAVFSSYAKVVEPSGEPMAFEALWP